MRRGRKRREGRSNLFPNNFQCFAVQRGWSAGIMYIRGLAGWSDERRAPVGADERTDRCGVGGAEGDGDTFFGCNFLSAPATVRFDQSLNPLPAPICLASHYTAYHSLSPLYLYRLATTSFPSSSSTSSHRHAGHPTAATHTPYHWPISPPYRCSITFAMHFFPSSFFIKLDYNCIASSSCGIAGRKNGTLLGMRVHPRSAGMKGRRERVRQNERSVLGERSRGWWRQAESNKRKKPMRFRGRLIGSRTYTYSPSTNPTVRVLIFASCPSSRFACPSLPSSLYFQTASFHAAT